MQTGEVPLRLYSATRKTYIGIRMSVEDAMERAEMLFGWRTEVSRATYDILSIGFTALGFSTYATEVLGVDDFYKTKLYKMVYSHSPHDYGAWAFHGSLPLESYAENGDALIVTSWLD